MIGVWPVSRNGDVYAALRDCHDALQLNPDHMKAHFRMARCLYELDLVQEAFQCLMAFKLKFSDYRSCPAVANLEKSINAAFYSRTEEGEKGGGRVLGLICVAHKCCCGELPTCHVAFHWFSPPTLSCGVSLVYASHFAMWRFICFPLPLCHVAFHWFHWYGNVLKMEVGHVLKWVLEFIFDAHNRERMLKKGHRGSSLRKKA